MQAAQPMAGSQAGIPLTSAGKDRQLPTHTLPAARCSPARPAGAEDGRLLRPGEIQRLDGCLPAVFWSQSQHRRDGGTGRTGFFSEVTTCKT